MSETNEVKQDNTKTETKKPSIKEILTESYHSVFINGQEIEYKVVTGTLILKEENEEHEEGFKPKASIFFTAYTKVNHEDPATRPLTFSFNGGPGSSSVWLHLGLLGPRRVQMGDQEGAAPRPPYRLVPNKSSLLDKTDLVFIDPVSTGLSRAYPGEKSKQFHEFQKDIESVGDFIRLYTSRYERWASPKFLIGESYGTTRASGLAGYLQNRHGFFLNGIMLVSTILNFQTARFGPGNDLPYVLFLPTYTATAWYHKRLPADLQADLHKALAEAESFAAGEYQTALFKGDALSANERNAIAEKLARLTGLSVDYIHQTNLRIVIYRFVKELLRSERKTIGRLDSRYTGFDRDAAGELNEFDPSYAAIQGVYTAALNDYLRRDLKFESDLPYEILNGNVWPWNYEKFQNQFVNVAETLRSAITFNPALKVIVANGYYDLATPYFATQYTFNHLELPEELRGNISMTYYEAGHMMYVRMESLARLKLDLAAFMEGAL